MHVKTDQFAQVLSTCYLYQLQQALNTERQAFYYLNMRSRQCLHVARNENVEFSLIFFFLFKWLWGRWRKNNTPSTYITYLPLIFCHWIIHFPAINSKLFFIAECKKRLKKTKRRHKLPSDGLCAQ